MNLGRSAYPKTVKEWDCFLKKYGYGIWEFAYCITKIIGLWDFKYRHPPDTDFSPLMKYGRREYYEMLGKRIAKMKKLKDKILYELNCYFEEFGLNKEEKLTPNRINFLTNVFDLKPFFNTFDEEVAYLESVMNIKYIFRKRGHPIEPRYVIASIWAQVMKDRRGINWRMITLLMDWFYDNLKDAIYCRVFGDSSYFSEDYFKKECHVIQEDKKRKQQIDVWKEAYFPKPRLKYFFKIRFNKDYIDVGGYYRDLESPLITFPNGITFP